MKTDLRRDSRHTATYRIVVEGLLEPRWSEWFGGMSVTVHEARRGHITVLTGELADQSALRGTLTRVWDLNLTLIAVFRLDHRCPTPSGEREE